MVHLEPSQRKLGRARNVPGPWSKTAVLFRLQYGYGDGLLDCYDTGVPSELMNVVNGSSILSRRAFQRTVGSSLAFQPV